MHRQNDIHYEKNRYILHSDLAMYSTQVDCSDTFSLRVAMSEFHGSHIIMTSYVTGFYVNFLILMAKR